MQADKLYLGDKSRTLYEVYYTQEQGPIKYDIHINGDKLRVYSDKRPEDFLSQIEPITDVTNRDVIIEMKIGDILTEYKNYEAIVDPTNYKLHNSSGLGQKIQNLAGKELLEELSKVGELMVTKTLVTDSYELECNKIIHLVTPEYINGMQKELELLHDCYMNIIDAAIKNKIRSIVLPSIATGGRGYPVDKAASCVADILFDVTSNFKGKLDKICFVFDNEETKKKYEYFYYDIMP